MTIRMVALDIDGTLIPPGGGHGAMPDPHMTSAVTALQEAGIVVVLASGRMFPGTARVARHLGLDTPLICQQGASVHLPNGTVSHRFALDREVARELAGFAQEHNWPYGWFDAVRYIASAPNPSTTEYALVSGIDPEYHEAPHQSDIEPTGVDIISTAADASRVHSVLEARFGGRAHFLDFPAVTGAHSPEASKGNALALLAQDLGIPREAVLAIGDSVNDVSMLRWAGVGVTLPHCDRYAREAADEILAGEGVERVAALLRSLL
jgi:hypothetical protein